MTSKELYTPGNIILSGYWRLFDLVLDYKEDEYGHMEYVVVCRCDKAGNRTERPRAHCTAPWRPETAYGDNIISTGNPIS